MDLCAYLHDRVRDHEMPPPEDSLVEADERADFVEEFESLLHNVSREYIATEGRVRSRRLNRIEYESTLHELLGVNIPLVELLPEDQATHGFINIAESQQLSYHVLQKYLEVVDVMLDESFGRAISPPPVASEPLPMEMQPTVIENQFGTIFHWEGKKLYHTTENKTYRHTNGEWIDMNSPLDLETTRTQNAELMERLTHGPFKRVYGPRELGAGKERIHNERQGIYHEGYVYSFPTTHGFHGRMAGTEVPSRDGIASKCKRKPTTLPKDAMFGDASTQAFSGPKHPPLTGSENSKPLENSRNSYSMLGFARTISSASLHRQDNTLGIVQTLCRSSHFRGWSYRHRSERLGDRANSSGLGNIRATRAAFWKAESKSRRTR